MHVAGMALIFGFLSPPRLVSGLNHGVRTCSVEQWKPNAHKTTTPPMTARASEAGTLAGSRTPDAATDDGRRACCTDLGELAACSPFGGEPDAFAVLGVADADDDDGVNFPSPRAKVLITESSSRLIPTAPLYHQIRVCSSGAYAVSRSAVLAVLVCTTAVQLLVVGGSVGFIAYPSVVSPLRFGRAGDGSAVDEGTSSARELWSSEAVRTVRVAASCLVIAAAAFLLAHCRPGLLRRIPPVESLQIVACFTIQAFLLSLLNHGVDHEAHFTTAAPWLEVAAAFLYALVAVAMDASMSVGSAQIRTTFHGTHCAFFALVVAVLSFVSLHGDIQNRWPGPGAGKFANTFTIRPMTVLHSTAGTLAIYAFIFCRRARAGFCSVIRFGYHQSPMQIPVRWPASAVHAERDRRRAGDDSAMVEAAVLKSGIRLASCTGGGCCCCFCCCGASDTTTAPPTEEAPLIDTGDRDTRGNAVELVCVFARRQHRDDDDDDGESRAPSAVASIPEASTNATFRPGADDDHPGLRSPTISNTATSVFSMHVSRTRSFREDAQLYVPTAQRLNRREEPRTRPTGVATAADTGVPPPQPTRAIGTTFADHIILRPITGYEARTVIDRVLLPQFFPAVHYRPFGGVVTALDLLFLVVNIANFAAEGLYMANERSHWPLALVGSCRTLIAGCLVTYVTCSFPADIVRNALTSFDGIFTTALFGSLGLVSCVSDIQTAHDAGTPMAIAYVAGAASILVLFASGVLMASVDGFRWPLAMKKTVNAFFALSLLGLLYSVQSILVRRAPGSAPLFSVVDLNATLQSITVSITLQYLKYVAGWMRGFHVVSFTSPATVQ